MNIPGRKGWWIAGAVVVVASLGLVLGRTSGQGAGAAGQEVNGLGLTFRPMPAWFKFRPKAEVQAWIDENDARSINEHAWELWGGLTTLTTETVGGQEVTYPTFETWVDEGTVFAPLPPTQAAEAAASRPKARPFTLPKQFLHSPADRARLRARSFAATAAGAGLLNQAPPMVVTVKYTKEIYDHVRGNRYYDPTVMAAQNQSWDANNPPTPLKDRVIKPFPDTSIMLKPTYQIVSGTTATIVPYWSGPANSRTPTTPDPTSWTKAIQLVPPGAAAAPVQGVPMVPIDRFYNFKLNAQEAAYINGLNEGTYKEGDYAILVAMHVSSREIDNWTWQTFWWSIDRPKIPASAAAHVKAPFDNYQVGVGYSFTAGPDSPTGLNVVCFSPYLEAGFDSGTFVKPGQLGIESNCMSCHRAAIWPDPKPFSTNYIANGIIDPGDPFFFTGSTKTDFVWGLGSDVPAPPSTPTPAPATGNR